MGERKRGVSRRAFLKGAAGTGVVVGNLGLLAEMAGAASNSISSENALAGSPADEWAAWDSDTIVGFASPVNVNPGEIVTFRIDTASTNYRIRIYRIGWYQGNGARRVGEIVQTLQAPATQPAPAQDLATGLKDCGNWNPTATWTVPANAVSGVYYALFERLDAVNESSFSLFVVGRPAASDILLQTSDETWQAYNTFGGNSLYVGEPAGRAYKVSYNRPFASLADSASHSWGWPESADGFFSNEYPLVAFLERNGYDVAYCTGIDTATNPSLLLNRKVFISSGHDEYWTGPQRTNVEAARDAGVNLIFMTGNEVFWKTRLEPSIDGTNTPNRTLVCYKETYNNAKIDPSPEWTGTWRDPRFSPPSNGGRPENALTGQLYLCMNPVSQPDFAIQVPYEYSRLRFWRDTAVASLPAGQVKTLTSSTLGFEWDADVDNGFRPAGLIRLSSTSATAQSVLVDNGITYVPGTVTHNLTMYRAASGALVFGTGTVQWCYGLDSTHTTDDPTPTDPIIQQATVNVLADMSAQPVTLQPGLVVATKSTDTLKPTSTITSPAANASIVIGTQTTIAGTASDTGGVVAGVEISTDGGTVWHPVTGTTSWSYSFMPKVLGPLTVLTRAIDDSCNVETPGAGRTFQITPRPYPVSIFAPSDLPATTSTNDAGALEVGVKFKADGGGFVSGIKFYKGAGNTGTHVGHLWNSSGALLGTGTFTNETASGWQTVNITPVAISGNTTYVASVYMPAGHYASSNGFFNTAYDLPPLRALANNEDGPNGVFRSGSSGYPVETYGATNYWVDVVVTGDNNAAPTVVDHSPAAGLQSVARTTTAVAYFSESLTANTLVMELRDAANAVVPSTVVYDATARKGTITPNAPLNALAAYTARVVSAKDAGGTPMAGPFSWSFTTAGAAGSTPASIWDTSATPTVLADTDTGAVELGVKFTSDLDGQITGLRYYKSPGSPGTALGHLWNAAGTLLGTVTYSTTTQSGWQQANLTTPVAITKNTVYIASYYVPNGIYPYTAGQFTSAGVDNGALHVAANAAAGGNGVYRYGASAFPNISASGTNYWADVVFATSADTGAPTIANAEPANNLISVALNAKVKATFSEAITTSTLAFTLKQGATTVASTVAYDAATLTATLTPTAALAQSQTYTATVSAKDVAGNAMTAPYTWSFTAVTPSGATPTTLWDTSAVPATPAANDNGSVELGMRFTTSQSGSITGIRFYKGAGNTGTHVGHLWSTTGALLGTVNFTNETASGWQQAKFASPIAVSAGTTYIASYLAPAGRYAVNSGFFSNSVTRGALSAPANTTGANNGLYVYGSGGFPTGSYASSNYWVDVIFEDSAAPSVTTQSPGAGAVNVPVNTAVTAKFSEPVQPATIVFQLRDGGGALVGGSTTYNSSTFTSTFTPTANLGSAATYTATVSGARDLQNNPMVAPASWSFSTTETGLSSLWSTTTVPAHPSVNDSDAVELGVKFRTAAPGVMRGIKFYKGTGNTGTHVGHLWTTAGVLLGTVNFTNETASGWQYAAFATPVRLTPGTTYVVSYFAPNGRYGAEGGFFNASGVTNGPLTALATGVDGGNGVYKYGATGGYPGSTYAASNYWVDLVFKAD